MKKGMLALALTTVMALSLSACGSGAKETTTAVTDAATTAAPADESSSDGAQTTEAATEAAGSKGTLVMATNAEFPPYEFHEGGEIVGIDVEIARAIATEMGMDFEIEDIAFDSVIPAVQSGKADFGAAGMTVSETRKQSVDFSDPYTTATQVIIVKEGSEITSMEDLGGKTVGVQLGTTGDLYVSDDEELGVAGVERYNKGFEAVQALLQNKIDAVVIDGEPAKIFISQNEGLIILDEAYTEEEYAICVKKGNTELLEGINAAIAKLKETGELQVIIDKYIAAE